MGTDIHLRVQKRVASEDATWEWTDGIGDRYDYGTSARQWYSQRSYDTFAILANVRNGAGFAGVDTGMGFVPISEPKGVPEDLRELYANEERQWSEDTDDESWTLGIGEHSHSWLTVQELVDYDWSRVSERRGILGLKEYWCFREQQEEWSNDYPQPGQWSGGIIGPSIAIVEASEADRIIKHLRGVESWRDLPNDNWISRVREGSASYHVRHSWPVLYAQAAEPFYVFCLPRLIKLAREVGSYEDVRIVFGFDS